MRSRLWRRFYATSTRVTWTLCPPRALRTATGPSSALTTATASTTSNACVSEIWRWSLATITRFSTAANASASSRRRVLPSATNCYGARNIAPITPMSRHDDVSSVIASVPPIFAARYLIWPNLSSLFFRKNPCGREGSRWTRHTMSSSHVKIRVRF